MSAAAVDLGALLLRAVPVALSLYKVSVTQESADELADAIGGVAKRAARLAKRGPLAAETRASLCRDASEQFRCVLPELTEDAIETLGEIVIDAIDERTDTGPLEEIDGAIVKRGLSALVDKIALWAEPDPGNLEALAKRARRQEAHAAREAERIERIAARKRARG